MPRQVRQGVVAQHLRGACRRDFDRLPVRHERGDAEIEHLRVPAIGDEDVGRLDIAVHDALACAASSTLRLSRASLRTSAIASGLPSIRSERAQPTTWGNEGLEIWQGLSALR